MNKVLVGSGVVLAAVVVPLSVIAAKFEPTIVPNTRVGMVDVGGLTKEEAAKKLRIWWEGERLKELTLVSPLMPKSPPPMTPGKLGITIDDQTSVAELPMSDLMSAASEKVTGGAGEPTVHEVKFKPVGANLNSLKELVQKSVGSPRPAKVAFVKGNIVKSPEVAPYTLDEAKMSEAVVEALKSDGKVELPLIEAEKKITDADLAKIDGVIGEFSTRFPAYQTARNTNLRLASTKLNGVVLMPGEQLSFNGTVGQRTLKAGYKSAPVIMNGRHDTGLGGGICQVSTTLYNAAVLANMKIAKRQNHSMPSAYVPVGRDATVDWGNLDLVIENNHDFPVAVTSEYQPGKLIFRVLGKKDPSLSVKVLTSGHRSWGRGVKIVRDPSLPAGRQKVVEKGSAGHSITSYRVLYKDGVEIKREVLARSVYRGAPRIIHVGSRPAAPKASAEPPVEPAPEEQGW